MLKKLWQSQKHGFRSLLCWFPFICIGLIVFDLTTTVCFSIATMKQGSFDTIARTERQISEYIHSVWNLGNAIASAPSTRDDSLSLRQRAQLLIPYADAYDLFMLGITDEKGLLGSTLERRQITSKAMLTDEGVGDLSRRPAFQEIMKTGNSILTDTYTAGADATTQIYTIWIPYYIEEKRAGAITVSIKFDFIDNIIRKTSLEDNYYFSLLDSKNNISSNPDTSLVGLPMADAYAKSKWVTVSLDELTRDLNAGNTGDYWGINNNRLEYVTYMPIKNTPWKLVMRTDFFGSFQNTFVSLTIKLSIYTSLFVLFSLKKNRDIFEREKLYDMMTHNVNNVFFVYHLDKKKFEYVSSNAQRILGISAEDFMNNAERTRSYFQSDSSYPEWTFTGTTRSVQKHLKNPQTGIVHPFRLNMYSVADKGKKWLILVINDEDEEQKKNSLLKEALSTAEQANHAKNIFLTSMSHDIRTPLNAMMGMTAIASASIENHQKVEDCLKKINLSGQHLIQLIKDILDMNMIESGRLSLNPQNFHIHEFMEKLKDMMQDQASGRNINFVVSATNIVHPSLKGDTLRLNQLLINLVNNAFKFTESGGTVHISATELDSRQTDLGIFQFRVTDNGIGISADFLEKIFEPFEREENSTISKTEGSGLGLAITKQLVTLMGGEIKVKSRPGEGSSFTVTIPLKLSDQPAGTAPLSEKSAAPDLSSRTILLVEDNELNMEIAQELLSMTGAKIESAWNGKEAVEKFTASPEHYYDIIITDIQMPVMDGFEAALAIRALDRSDAAEIPIIAMTADAFAESMGKAGHSGMNGYITKPVNPEYLLEVLRTWLL